MSTYGAVVHHGVIKTLNSAVNMKILTTQLALQPVPMLRNWVTQQPVWEIRVRNVILR